MYFVEDSAALAADTVAVHSAGDVRFLQRNAIRSLAPVLEIA
jgi:hypothetical protein